MKRPAKAALPRLKPEHLQAAAQWLAITNLGYDGPPPKDAHQLRVAVQGVASNPDEAPGAVRDETATWLADLKHGTSKGREAVLRELHAELPWLFEAAQ